MDDIDPNKLRPTDDDEVLFSIAHGLRFDGKKRLHYADDHMARIAAQHLLKQLKQSGYVVMKKPPASAPKAPDYGIPMKDRGVREEVWEPIKGQQGWRGLVG